MLVGKTQRIAALHGFDKDRRILFLEFLDHAFAAAGIAGDAMHRQGKIGGHQPGPHQRPRQRQKTRGPAAGIGDPLAGGDAVVEMPAPNSAKAIGPAFRDAMRGGGVDHPHVGIFDQRHRLARRVVGQAQDHQIGFVERTCLARASSLRSAVAAAPQVRDRARAASRSRISRPVVPAAPSMKIRAVMTPIRERCVS